eukprot:293999-Chlamydomonas_euryale.AAC.5
MFEVFGAGAGRAPPRLRPFESVPLVPRGSGPGATPALSARPFPPPWSRDRGAPPVTSGDLTYDAPRGLRDRRGCVGGASAIGVLGTNEQAALPHADAQQRQQRRRCRESRAATRHARWRSRRGLHRSYALVLSGAEGEIPGLVAVRGGLRGCSFAAVAPRSCCFVRRGGGQMPTQIPRASLPRTHVMNLRRCNTGACRPNPAVATLAGGRGGAAGVRPAPGSQRRRKVQRSSAATADGQASAFRQLPRIRSDGSGGMNNHYSCNVKTLQQLGQLRSSQPPTAVRSQILSLSYNIFESGLCSVQNSARFVPFRGQCPMIGEEPFKTCRGRRLTCTAELNSQGLTAV